MTPFLAVSLQYLPIRLFYHEYGLFIMGNVTKEEGRTAPWLFAPRALAR
jgi:hypothetical protein